MRSYPYKRIISVIPARGGSRGVFKKNIRRLNDRPMIDYTIEASLSCPLIDRTIVSTEDSEIKKINCQLASVSHETLRIFSNKIKNYRII